MLPVDVAAIGADFWVGNLHKWAFAPRGTAAAGRWRRGWRRADRAAGRLLGAGGRLSRCGVEWQGTLDYTAWLAAPAGLYTLRTLGVDRVRAHNAALAAYGQRVVGERSAWRRPTCPTPAGRRSRCGSCRCRPGLATTIADAARRCGSGSPTSSATEVAVNAWGGRGWLRLSRPGLQPGRGVRPPRRGAAGPARPAHAERARRLEPRPAAAAAAQQACGQIDRTPGARPSAGRPAVGRHRRAPAAATPGGSTLHHRRRTTGRHRLVGGAQPSRCVDADHAAPRPCRRTRPSPASTPDGHAGTSGTRRPASDGSGGRRTRCPVARRRPTPASPGPAHRGSTVPARRGGGRAAAGRPPNARGEIASRAGDAQPPGGAAATGADRRRQADRSRTGRRRRALPDACGGVVAHRLPSTGGRPAWSRRSATSVLLLGLTGIRPAAATATADRRPAWLRRHGGARAVRRGQPPKPASSGSEMSGFSSSSTLTSLNVITRTFFTKRAGRYMSQTQASCISTSK